MRQDDNHVGKEESDLNKLMKNNMADINMTQEKKQQMKILMQEEMRLCRQGTFKRMMSAFSRFLDTTYEISLAPVLAVTGAVAIGFTFVGTAQFLDIPNDKKPAEVMYIQQVVSQPDGGAQVTYIPVRKGGS